MAALPGISRGGVDAEATFRKLTGATEAKTAALGDAVLGGHYIEVKQARSSTLNQVRAVKYITLVAFSVPNKRWFVIPANEIVRQCARKMRGQHTENPFESATLSLYNLKKYALRNPKDLKDAVLKAIDEAKRYPALKKLMDEVLHNSKTLAQASVADVQVALRQYGLS